MTIVSTLSQVGAVCHEDVAAVSRAASFLEIEISRGYLNLFERQGDGKTADVVEMLARYGLHLAERVSSPCG